MLASVESHDPFGPPEVAFEFLWRHDLGGEELLSPPEGFQRGQVLGLVDLAETTPCPGGTSWPPATEVLRGGAATVGGAQGGGVGGRGPLGHGRAGRLVAPKAGAGARAPGRLANAAAPGGDPTGGASSAWEVGQVGLKGKGKSIEGILSFARI